MPIRYNMCTYTRAPINPNSSGQRHGPRTLATAAGLDTGASLRHPKYRLQAAAAGAGVDVGEGGLSDERRQALRRLVASVLQTRGAWNLVD